MDFAVLVANLRSHGSVRFFATVLRGEAGQSTQVEISAVSVRNGGQPSLGFAIRNVGARLVEPVSVQSPPCRARWSSCPS